MGFRQTPTSPGSTDVCQPTAESRVTTPSLLHGTSAFTMEETQMAATTRRRRRVETKPVPPRGDFSFTTSDGVTITVPPFSTLKPGFIRKIRKLDQADQFFTMLEEVLDVRWQDKVDAKRAELEAARDADDDSEVSDREAEKLLEPDDTLDVIDDLEPEDFQDFQRGWFEHSGVDLGE